MSGVELANRLVNEKLGVPVVLITGFLTEDVRREASEAGIRTVLRKPTDLTLLSRTLSELLPQTQHA
jgi:CheY-like chemotaxis protein